MLNVETYFHNILLDRGMVMKLSGANFSPVLFFLFLENPWNLVIYKTPKHLIGE